MYVSSSNKVRAYVYICHTPIQLKYKACVTVNSMLNFTQNVSMIVRVVILWILSPAQMLDFHSQLVDECFSCTYS